MSSGEINGISNSTTVMSSLATSLTDLGLTALTTGDPAVCRVSSHFFLRRVWLTPTIVDQQCIVFHRPGSTVFPDAHSRRNLCVCRHSPGRCHHIRPLVGSVKEERSRRPAGGRILSPTRINTGYEAQRSCRCSRRTSTSYSQPTSTFIGNHGL
jgi:hypothetical protein